MCYNAEVSATTFLGVTAVCLFLWYRNAPYDHPIALILFFVSLMQAVEWGLWRNLDCGTVNKLLTAFIPLLLCAQPLVLNWVVGHYNAGWGSGYKAIAYAILPLIGFKAYQVYTKYGQCATVKDGHLQWSTEYGAAPFSGIEHTLYSIAMLYPLLTFKNTAFSVLYSAFALLSFFIYSSSYTTTWPSIWCHFINFLAVFALIK